MQIAPPTCLVTLRAVAQRSERCHRARVQVIKGLDYAIMRMVENEKATWFIPAELGYGAAGAGGIIPPDADLIYEIDLMEVHEMQEKAPTRGNQKKNKARGKEQDHVQSSEGETIVGESEEQGEGQARRCVCM